MKYLSNGIVFFFKKKINSLIHFQNSIQNLTTHLTVGLIKNILLYKMSYFPDPHTDKCEIEVELDLSNHATKSD